MHQSSFPVLGPPPATVGLSARRKEKESQKKNKKEELSLPGAEAVYDTVP